ncbi:MAG: HD domain-containing protein [Candidatus Peregrinibacteria bacterium]
MATTYHHRPEACTIVACHLDPLVPVCPPAAPLTLSDYVTLRDAITFARSAHAGQKRASGRPFVSHPLAVLQILRSVSLELPPAAYFTALLHDTVEDGTATLPQIRATFGNEVEAAVDALTRPKRPKGVSIHDHERDYLAQMAEANTLIPYVLHIKMADRLHNLETAHFCAPAYRQALFTETSTLYLPLLEREELRQDRHAEAYRTLLTLLDESVSRMR